ncbi:hypothetical protein TNCV_4364251 [Trichonephila clavipes]|nr:hypothetical protein TNCV_4364251 [Trichonephila clavipes]
MKEEKLLDHVIFSLEPQILDYVEVRHPQATSNLLQIIYKYEERFLNRRIRRSSQEFRDITKARAIVSLTGIGRKIGGRQEVATDTLTIADSKGSSTELKVKLLGIIGDSIVDAEVVKLIIDSIIKAFDRVVRGTVRSGV